MALEKTFTVLFLILWIWGGVYLVKNFQKIFGAHPDDPSESPGARSLGQTQIWATWVGVIVALIWFLFS